MTRSGKISTSMRLEKIKTHVLIIDDSVTIRRTIEKHLGDDYTVSHASNGQEAWELIQSDNTISLAFLDMHMPVMNGMLLLKQIRSSKCGNISNLPVIMITGHDDSDTAKKISYAMGATDFISKPFSSIDIISRAGSYTKLTREISTLEENVTYDSLTKLYNKQGLEEIGKKAISSSHRHQHAFSVLIIQIKDSDKIESKFSKKIIQQIIISIADYIKKSLRDEDVLAHFGSGKFAVLLTKTKAFKARIIALKIQQSIDKLIYKIEGNSVKIKLAVGLNSNENCDYSLTFSELCLPAETEALTSSQNKACKIIRRDELIHKRKYTEKHKKSYPGHEEKTASSDYSATDSKSSDIENQKDFMLEILNGDFEKIPRHHIAHLIKPMESFLNYAHNLIQKQ